MPDDRIIECARQMFARWARIADPKDLDRRWSRMPDQTRLEWIKDAETCVETWRQVA